MSAVRTSLSSLLSAVVLAGGLAFTAAGPASAATCPATLSPRIDGADAHWTLRCNGNNVTMDGWVEDTAWDGDCAILRVNAGNGKYNARKACGSGTRESIHYTYTGTRTVEGRLALVD